MRSFDDGTSFFFFLVHPVQAYLSEMSFFLKWSVDITLGKV